VVLLKKMLFLYNIDFRPILIKIFINIAFNESNFHLKMIKMDKILVAVNKTQISLLQIKFFSNVQINLLTNKIFN